MRLGVPGVGRRHVRLRKGFVNLENAAFGGLKLRIPSTLLVEKMRTQTRFNVSQFCRAARERAGPSVSREGVFRERVLKEARRQMMRMEVQKGKERKAIQNASSKVNLVIQRMLLPLLEVPMRSHVSFEDNGDELELALLDHVSSTRPEVMADEQSFLGYFQVLFQRYMRPDG